VNLGSFANSLQWKVKRNSPIILTVAASIGTLATAYLTARATVKALKVVHHEDAPVIFDPREQLIQNVRSTWKFYIPPAICGASTIACIVGSNRIGANKLIAASTAATIAETAFSEYREKVIETHGKNKEQKIRDDIAEDKVRANVPSSEVLLVGSGHVLCCELRTGRYFNSTMEALRKAQNDINAKLISHPYVTMSDFYWEVDLPLTSVSSNVGWQDGKMMELEFSTVLTDDGRPCLAFDYNYVELL